MRVNLIQGDCLEVLKTLSAIAVFEKVLIK